jgi:hypothetical protein
MSLLLDRDPPPLAAPERPELGVIKEARARQRRRRWRAAAIVIAGVVAGIGGLLWGGVIGGGSGASSPGHHSPRLLAPRLRAESNGGAVRLTPALEGGSYGWNVILGEGATCCTTPARGNLLAGGMMIGQTGSEQTLTFLSGTEVAAVIVNGKERVPVRALPGRLPFGLRLSQIEIPTRPAERAHGRTTVPAPPPLTPQAFIPLDGRGQEIRSVGNPEPRFSIRWWERPAPLPRGPCHLSAHGLSGLAAQWGHVATAIRPYPGRIIGRAFFSCIDTEYYLQGWPLDAAIVLDAAHPGAPPAAIPGLRAMASEPGYLGGPGDFHGDLTATRVGNAWLVVAGGSGPAQRVGVLRHLTATIRL